MPIASPALAPAGPLAPSGEVHLPRLLLDRLVTTTSALHRAGLKAFGLLVADPRHPRFPFTATDVVVFDPTKNRRNAPAMRAAFEAQGDYFRAYDDAGFVADPAELLKVHRRLEASELEAVALFHVHRRQPANFSVIDFRLHNPAYAWHLIISLRDPGAPVLRPFAVRKDPTSEFGISAEDSNQGSELPYLGEEVSPLRLVTDDVDAAGRASASRPAPAR